MRVFVLVKTKINFELIAPSVIEDFLNVTRVILTKGSYDMIVDIESNRDDGVKATIKKIRKLDYILGTSTLVKRKGDL